jgi:hypothetical protein
MKTDTPRTNTIAHHGYSEAEMCLRLLDLCRELEREIEDCRSALQVIHTWATFRGGMMLDDRPSVARLCKRVLDDLSNGSDDRQLPAASRPESNHDENSG